MFFEGALTAKTLQDLSDLTQMVCRVHRDELRSLISGRTPLASALPMQNDSAKDEVQEKYRQISLTRKREDAQLASVEWELRLLRKSDPRASKYFPVGRTDGTVYSALLRSSRLVPSLSSLSAAVSTSNQDIPSPTSGNYHVSPALTDISALTFSLAPLRAPPFFSSYSWLALLSFRTL